MSDKPIIMWFRKDLRLHDNPALSAAVSTRKPLICLYIRETGIDGARPFGGASSWWLNKSIISLNAEIETLGGKLVLKTGHPQEVLEEIIGSTGADTVFWNRRYEGDLIEADKTIKSALTSDGALVKSFPGNLLMEPFKIQTADGGPYRVFSPFWRKLQSALDAPVPLEAPAELTSVEGLDSDALNDWGLHPNSPDWSSGLEEEWTPGESGAQTRLDAFLKDALADYAGKRDIPAGVTTSKLSPHLHFGEISVQAIWSRVQDIIQSGRADEKPAQKFLSELAWRDFSYHLLFHYPTIDSDNFQPKFDAFSWRADDAALEAWRRGRTGYPIVDAGMRELWHTGWMHNRIRMVAASFLTKHLLIDWREGETWFWDTLVDADPASNAASWQWVAGSGADAAPYFRIFNPIAQGEKFDPDGHYVRKWCPELSGLPNSLIHHPWDAPSVELKRAGVILGDTYPLPIVDHSAARQRALDAYDDIKTK